MLEVDPTAVTPSQLYLNRAKLTAVLERDDRYPDPVHVMPADSFEGVESEWVLVNGHTRAFVAWLCDDGALDAEVYEDCPPVEHDVYRRCLEWCRDAGVRSVTDLAGRVVEPDTYDSVWLDRCRQVEAELTE